NATVQPDVVGPALALNTPVTATLGNGQVDRFTINATAGQDLSLSIAGVTTTPSGQPVQVSVYSPGTILTTNALLSTSYTSSGTLQLSNLPTTGTYTVVVSTTGLPASLQMTLAAVAASTNGQAGTYTGYLAGQTANVPFTANAG
ncbi:pre-peptidase C-terminal domain-containing protein, partial [Burkholderia pseudomallei]|uniref:pre-peptidase C-terminal domain-containing protein n=1 Tax=Burkholderia pseudomallei TaxID=28450 RepID=UPI00351BFDA3